MQKKVFRFLYHYRYAVILGAFGVWMAFFDKSNWWDMYQLHSQYKDVERERDYYLEQTEVAKKEYSELFSTQESLEKFAREKYLMKKDNEDIFVILKKED